MDLVWGCIMEIVKKFNIKYEDNEALWDNKLTKAQIHDKCFYLRERAIHRLFLDVERKDKRIEELKEEIDFFKDSINVFRDEAKKQRETLKEYEDILEQLMSPWHKKLWNRLKSLKCPKISIEW